jgi:putative peptidoglycan lipid II flippase
MSNSDPTSPVNDSPDAPDETKDSEIFTENNGGKKPERHNVTKSAGIVSIAVMFSRLFGLAREMVFSRYFGSGYLYDAFVVAFRVPNLLRDLLAEGALSVAFVKVFTDYQVNVSEKEAWRLAAIVFNGLAVVLSVVVIIGIIFAPYYVPYIAWNFPPEKAAFATYLTRIMFPFILLVSLAAVTMGVLNTKGKFGIPATASTAFNIVSIIAGLGFAYYLSGGSWDPSSSKDTVPELPAQWAITGMAIGVLFGGLAQIGIQLPSLFKAGFRFRPLLSFTDRGVKRVMRLMGPALIGTSAIEVKVLVDTFMVSGIEGAQGWLSYAFRLMQFPIGLFGAAIAIASLPTLARFGSEHNLQKFRQTLSNSLGLVFLLTIPSACGLIILGEPIIRLLYEGGAFDSADTTMVTWALASYSIGLAGYAAIKVLSPSFYALDDAKTPMYVAVASVSVHAVASYSLMTYFSTVGVTPERPNGYGHIGVALATSTVATINFLALTFLMRRKIKRLEGRKIASSLIKTIIAAAVMSVVSYFSYQYLTNVLGEKTFLIKLVEAFVPIGLGGLTFLVCAKLLGVDALNQLVDIFKQKMAK